MLTQNQIDFYNENGFLKYEALFTPEETAELSSEMVRIIEQWGNETIGWRGPWRDLIGGGLVLGGTVRNTDPIDNPQ